MRRFTTVTALACLSLSLLLAACGGGGGDNGDDNGDGDDCTPNDPPGMICAAEGGTVEGAGSIDGARIEIPADALAEDTLVTVQQGGEIIPAEFTAAGPPVIFAPTDIVLASAATITLPFTLPEERTAEEVVVFHDSSTEQVDAAAVTVDADAGRITLRSTALGTFEPALENLATRTRHYTFRAIAGFSMGGASAMALGIKYHEYFDIIAPQGTAVDLFAWLNYLKYSALGGFCEPGQTPTADGSMCPTSPMPCHVAGPPEYFANAVACGNPYPYHFERMDGGGPKAGGFDRSGMFEAFADQTHALANFFTYNPAHKFLPAGVTADYYWDGDGNRRSRDWRCSNPVVVEKLYDHRFNPDGVHNAITFCDGNSGIEQGLWSPDAPNDLPTDVLLAFDYNGNQVRDPGEPVVFQLAEPYEDVGADGLADADEPGYDASTNPDPSGDNYHMYTNALGTEGNGRFESGEPYEDIGIDGVVCPGACPHDFGEGNGQFDYTPNLQSLFTMNPNDILMELSDEALDRLDFYIDTGYRDHFFFGPNTFGFIGLLRARSRDAGVFKGFAELTPDQDRFKFDKVPWSNLPRDILVIYGDRSKSEEEARATGDGGHVGTSLQVVNRALVFLGYVSAHWPEGDYEPAQVSGNNGGDVHTYTSAMPGLEGVQKEFYVYEPPDYEPPDAQGNCAKRYPVLYSLHGIGMNPEDQMAAPLLFETWMQSGTSQKYLVVLPNGRCLPNECDSGQFYFDTAGWAVPGKAHERSFIEELIPYVDEHWCTKKPKTIENAPW